MNNNQKQNNNVTINANKDSSLTENWITVKEINNNLIFLDSKEMVTGVKIQPKNIFIMDQNSQAIMIDTLKTFYNQVDFEFWLIVADRPVDISVYISQLEVHLGNVQNPAIRKLIANDIEKADLFVQNDVVDTEYFILFKEKRLEIVQKKLRNLIMNLANAGLNSVQVSNNDLRVILDNFFNDGANTSFGTVM